MILSESEGTLPSCRVLKGPGVEPRGGSNWRILRRIPFGKIGVHLRED